MVDRTLRRIFILSGIALILWVLYLLKPVVLPFIAAFLVAYLFSPLVEKLHKIGLPRWLAISLVFIGIGVVLTLAIGSYLTSHFYTLRNCINSLGFVSA